MWNKRLIHGPHLSYQLTRFRSCRNVCSMEPAFISGLLEWLGPFLSVMLAKDK